MSVTTDEDVLRILTRAQGAAEGLRALDSLLARLAAAETEREKAVAFLRAAEGETRAAEARVEAAERERDNAQMLLRAANDSMSQWGDRLAEQRALRAAAERKVEAAKLYERLSDGFRSGDGTEWADVDKAKRDLRAALACPPQQRGEK